MSGAQGVGVAADVAAPGTAPTQPGWASWGLAVAVTRAAAAAVILVGPPLAVLALVLLVGGAR
ncbi:MAG: hypothetical protein JWO67_1507 [Streptosporangiaceae bacterium]|nr:hypothetical protein [Streptosporangiaceae bacterium]